MAELCCLGLERYDSCDCVASAPPAAIVVMAEPDDTPCDMDDSVSVSYRYLDLLVSRANSTHCATCTCHN